MRTWCGLGLWFFVGLLFGHVVLYMCTLYVAACNTMFSVHRAPMICYAVLSQRYSTCFPTAIVATWRLLITSSTVDLRASNSTKLSTLLIGRCLVLGWR